MDRRGSAAGAACLVGRWTVLDPEDFTPAGCLSWLALIASTGYVIWLVFERVF